MQNHSSNSNMTIFMTLLLMFGYVSIYKQANAQDWISIPEQQSIIDSELSHYWHNLEDVLQVEVYSKALIRYQRNILKKDLHANLLQEIIADDVCNQSELLPKDTEFSPGNNKYKGNGTELLNELIIEASN